MADDELWTLGVILCLVFSVAFNHLLFDGWSWWGFLIINIISLLLMELTYWKIDWVKPKTKYEKKHLLEFAFKRKMVCYVFVMCASFILSLLYLGVNLLIHVSGRSWIVFLKGMGISIGVLLGAALLLVGVAYGVEAYLKWNASKYKRKVRKR